MNTHDVAASSVRSVRHYGDPRAQWQISSELGDRSMNMLTEYCLAPQHLDTGIRWICWAGLC